MSSRITKHMIFIKLWWKKYEILRQEILKFQVLI